MAENCKRYRQLMMGLMDDELNADEAAEVNDHLTRCNSCRQEFEEIKKSSASLKNLAYKESRDIELDRIWKSPYTRLSKNLAIIMIIAGWAAIIIFSIFEILKSHGEPLIPKLSTIIVIFGFFILLFVAIRDRIKTYRSDPYKEVER